MGFGRAAAHACALDVPADFRVSLFESGGNREDSIYRSKAVGEPPLMLPLSVFSAINDAICSLKPAVFPRLDAPATPEAIMRAIRPAGTET
jgi:xanthine dehydrogenase large subunit